jgi:hypothetical protein
MGKKASFSQEGAKSSPTLPLPPPLLWRLPEESMTYAPMRLRLCF